MKRFLFLITFVVAFAWNTGEVIAQEPIPATVEKADTTHPAFLDVVPDTVVIELDGQEIRFVATDAKDLASFIVQEYTNAKQSDDPPKNLWEWILYAISVIGIGTLVSRVTQAIKVVNQLKGFFAKRNSPANIVALVSLAVSVAGSFVWPGGFSIEKVILWSPWVFTAGILVYENFLKSRFKKEETA